MDAQTLQPVGVTHLVDHAGRCGDVLDPLHGRLWHFVGAGRHRVSHDVGLIHCPVGHCDADGRKIVNNVCGLARSRRAQWGVDAPCGPTTTKHGLGRHIHAKQSAWILCSSNQSDFVEPVNQNDQIMWLLLSNSLKIWLKQMGKQTKHDTLHFYLSIK